MKLTQALNGLKYRVEGNGDVDIDSLACDTGRVKDGCLFFCLKGGQADGHDFAVKAVADGAVAVVVERILPHLAATQILVEDSRSSMSLVAKNFYDNSDEKLKIIAVIGTNGKTSTTYILKSIFETAGYLTAVIGTNGIVIGDKRFDSPLTTPDPIEMHEWFSIMVNQGVKYVIMEVSAHAIALRKMDGIRADVSVFTNFSRDHLDFFKNMQEYGDTKMSFFAPTHTKVAVVNADDNLGRQIINDARIPLVSYGFKTPSDVFAIDYSDTDSGIEYTINLYDEIAKVNFNLFGEFNLYNTLCAATTARVFGIKLPTITQGIEKVRNIDGRNETFYKCDKRIVVDFAHTPDGVNNILSYLKSTCKGKLIVVFGCGGNRDRFKRPLIAQNVSKYADDCIITNDNPRYEPYGSIIEDIEGGMSIHYDIIFDRTQAIATAISKAKAGDTIAILGKGAEKYQEIKGVKIPLSDVDTVQKILKSN